MASAESLPDGPGVFDDASQAFVRFERAVLDVRDAELFVGVQGTKGSGLAVIAMANEFGTRTIPERSFFRATMDRRREHYANLLEEAVERALDGQGAQRRDLEKIGAIAVGDIQRFMTELRQPPNAPSTIRKKKSSNPLIDTGRLRRSISFKVEMDTNPQGHGDTAFVPITGPEALT